MLNGRLLYLRNISLVRALQSAYKREIRWGEKTWIKDNKKNPQSLELNITAPPPAAKVER